VILRTAATNRKGLPWHYMTKLYLLCKTSGSGAWCTLSILTWYHI